MFATAPRHGFLCSDLHLHRRESCALVRAIAKRLAFGSSAHAPIITASLGALNDGGFLGYYGFAHDIFVDGGLVGGLLNSSG
jgi:hypothetical protein